MHVARRSWGILAVGLFLTIVSTTQAKYSGGTGEPNDPYQMATAADLIALGETPADYDKHFILTADIDLDPNLPGRKVFDKAVIARLTGVFDGNGHTISHLTIEGGGHLGLFAELRMGAEVRDLGIADVNITASDDYTGALVGTNGGALTGCYTTGVVRGREDVGGLAGDNWGPVAQCYSVCAVSGGNGVGGLIGENSNGTVSNCYSIGAIRGTGQDGGLMGYNGGTVVHCFWDTETSGQTTSAGGTGKTTAQMQTASTFLEAGWDFVGETANGPNDVWKIVEGQTYPLLSWQKYSGGRGELNDPYQIATAADLIALGNEPNDCGKHFKLMADIDLDPNLLGGQVFGSAIIPRFSGTLDGSGFAIRHLTIVGRGNLGLFGSLDATASIANMAIIDASVTGEGEDLGILAGISSGCLASCSSTGSLQGQESDHVGGLVGTNSGLIERCFSSCSVSSIGPYGTAGLVGSNNGIIKESHCEGGISGGMIVGGFVGMNNKGGLIRDCYSTATVVSGGSRGGFAGLVKGDIAHCYSTGLTSGGGFVGVFKASVSGSVSQSFWDIKTSGQTSSAAGTGKTTAQMQTAKTFLEAGWDFVGEVANGTDDIWWINEGKDYPRLRWEMPPRN